MEIEAKFLTRSREALDRLANATELGSFRLGPIRRERLVTLYLDSPGGALRRAGIAFRVRRRRRGIEATIKTRGGRQGAVHRREEWTVVLRRMPRLPLALPEGLRQRVPEKLRGLRCSPFLTTIIERRTRRVRARGRRHAVAELALDEVAFSRHPGRGETSIPFFEIEIELCRGSAAELDEMAEALRATVRAVPSRLSKLARGLRWASLERRNPVIDRDE